MSTEHFRKQHAEIADIVGQINASLIPNKLEANPAPMRALFLKLSGKLSVHLAMEDDSLYPKLMKHGDEKVRTVAKAFSTEMADVKPKFEGFVHKWNEAAIRGGAPAFCDETRKLFGVLADRMRREDRELYDMVDRIGA